MSSFLVYTQLHFESNHASELGGAIYATSPNQAEFVFSHKCFISYYESFSNPDKWNTSLTFIDNTAKYGYAIYTDSLLPCAKQLGGAVTNISASLQWKPFNYIPYIPYTIATSPAHIDFTFPADISPGERINIHPLSMDDLDQPIPSAYRVILKNVKGTAETNPFMSDDGFLQITGQPGVEFNLTLITLNTRHVSVTRPGSLGNCPLGFTLDNSIHNNGTCICSTSTKHKYLFGITECNISSFQAFLQIGYWIGCTDSNDSVTGYCPSEYCTYNTSAGFNVVVPKSCNKPSTLCVEHRKGQLCGECEGGYTVYFHSETFKCGKCEYGAVGPLLYVVTELIPLVLLFVAVMTLKFKMTSGVMQSLLLFAQTITLINRAPSFIKVSPTSYTFIKVHTFLLGFLSLDFFRLDEASFCLWKGATVLHNLVFRYVTTLFSILLLGLFILIANRTSAESEATICGRLKKMSEKMKMFKNAIVHGITTFLILSYTLYTVTSFQILSRLTLTGEGGVTRGSFVRLQGNVEYFGVDHLPYAIPAVLVLLFLSLPPPLLLISYPLLWRVKAKFRSKTADDDATPWLIRKLLPLIDSFQGVFRDNCRMFAGLLFLWRLILTAIFALSSNLREFFLLTEIALLCFFTIHAVARPYKQRLYNMIDVVMLGNMAVINLITWYISGSYFSKDSIVAANAIKIVLMYIPIISVSVFIIYRLLRKCNAIPELKVIHFSINEEEPSHDTVTFNTRKMTSQERKESCVDEDLFARAAEVNNPPLVLAGSEAGFELQSRENTKVTTAV